MLRKVASLVVGLLVALAEPSTQEETYASCSYLSSSSPERPCVLALFLDRLARISCSDPLISTVPPNLAADSVFCGRPLTDVNDNCGGQSMTIPLGLGYMISHNTYFDIYSKSSRQFQLESSQNTFYGFCSGPIGDLFFKIVFIGATTSPSNTTECHVGAGFGSMPALPCPISVYSDEKGNIVCHNGDQLLPANWDNTAQGSVCATEFDLQNRCAQLTPWSQFQAATKIASHAGRYFISPRSIGQLATANVACGAQALFLYVQVTFAPGIRPRPLITQDLFACITVGECVTNKPLRRETVVINCQGLTENTNPPTLLFDPPMFCKTDENPCPPASQAPFADFGLLNRDNFRPFIVLSLYYHTAPVVMHGSCDDGHKGMTFKIEVSGSGTPFLAPSMAVLGLTILLSLCLVQH